MRPEFSIHRASSSLAAVSRKREGTPPGAAWRQRPEQARALLVALLRGHPPDLILDSCSTQAKRATNDHVAVSGDGVPGACAAMAAYVKDALLFERLFLMTLAVVARIRTVFADKGYGAGRRRDLCRTFGAEPRIHRCGRPHGSELGRRRCPGERSNAWILEDRRLALRYGRLGSIVQPPQQAACLLLVAGRLAREL